MYIHVVFSRRSEIADELPVLLPEGKLIDNRLLIDSDGRFIASEESFELRLSSGNTEQSDKSSLDFSATHKYRNFQLRYEKSSCRLSLTSDRFATIQVFYYLADDVFLLSTSFEFLLSMMGERRKSLDYAAASELVDFGYVLYGKTLIEGVKRFPYACQVLVTPSDNDVHRYWDFNFNESLDDPADIDILRDELSERLFSAIAECIPASTDIVIPLSGGMDSRLILAVALEVTESSRVTAFTFGQAKTQDVEIASQITKNLGLKHIVENVGNEKDVDLSKEDWVQSYLNNIDITKGLIDATPGAPTREKCRGLLDFGSFFFSGYMGDPLMGSHLVKDMLVPISSVSKPIQNVLSRQRINPLLNTLVNHCIGAPPPMLLQSLNRYKTLAGYSMHWDFAVRQQDYIKNGQIYKFADMFDVRTPFIEPVLFEFGSTQIPLKQKLDEFLYLQANIERFPDLFKKYSLTNTGALRVEAKPWEKVIARVMRKLNNVIQYRLFPVYPKLNYRNYTMVSRYQKEYRQFLMKNCLEFCEQGIITNDILNMLGQDLQNQCLLSNVMGRLSTINLFIKHYRINN